MSTEVLFKFQAYIQQHFLDVLQASPIESTTPFQIENALTGTSEFLFISKCSPYMYEPVKNRNIYEATNVKFSMYIEENNLIIRFDLLDMMLESEIQADKVKSFLSILLHQETITLAIVDSKQYNLIWLTNTIPFRTIRFHYKEIFEQFGVA